MFFYAAYHILFHAHIYLNILLKLICFVELKQGVLDGKYDDLPEQSFYMVGGIDEVIAKAEKIAKESAA